MDSPLLISNLKLIGIWTPLV